MYLGICCGVVFVIGIIVSLIRSYKEYNSLDGSDIALGFLAGMITGCIALVISLVIGYSIKPNYEVRTESVNLVTLGDNPATAGQFYFLGSGSFDGTMKYVFYYETDDGMEMGMISYHGVKIKYEDSTPRYEQDIKYHKSKWSYRDEERIINRRFIVPDGTVKKGFVLDAQ